MRLTLRTMLAYLDDVLDPAEAEVLGKKIEESEFASGLVVRIKGVLKKLRMDAPKLDGKGMGNDANAVAEYLDSSLPQDRVGEFERVCLESDKHLCEVAACHQILTLVLGKPADVPADLRDRIYALGDPNHVAPRAAADTMGEAVRAGSPPAMSGNGRPVEKPAPLEVPEYLRAGRQQSVWPLVLVAAAALMLALIGLRAMGPFDSNHPVARALRRSAPIAMNGDAAKTDQQTDTERAAAHDVKPATTADTTAAPTEATPTTPDAAAAAAPAVAAATPAPSAAAIEPETPAAPGAIVTESPDRVAATVPSRPPIPNIPDTPDTTTPTPSPAEIAVAPKATKGKGPAGAAVAKPAPMEIGRYISDGQLLATFDEDSGLWYPKHAQEVLTAGERLVVLPPYRPQLALPSAVQLTFAGEGAAWVAEPGADRIPRVVVECGRFLAATAGKAGAQVELDLAGIKGVATLVDADSVLAIKTARWVPPGMDPEAGPGMPVIEMYNVNGRATWQQVEREKVAIPTHSVHVYVGDDPPETHGPFMAPEWTDAKSTRPIDRDAAIVLERLVNNERPLNLSLQETMKDRRVEVRALTARCLAALGDFEAILRELNDANQYSFWPGEFDALRHAINHGPEVAAKLRETLNLVRAGEAKDLYRMLWGYSEDQLPKGAADQLIRNLESDQIDIRVLAYLNLASITGATTYYRPEKPTAQAIKTWKDRRDKGTIAYRTPPSPLDTYKSMAGPAGAETRSGTPGAAAPR
jgi:hypothetical protein